MKSTFFKKVHFLEQSRKLFLISKSFCLQPFKKILSKSNTANVRMSAYSVLNFQTKYTQVMGIQIQGRQGNW